MMNSGDSATTPSGKTNSIALSDIAAEGAAAPPTCEETAETDEIERQWRLVVARCDFVFFIVFSVLFSLLMLIMLYPYDNVVRLDKEQNCTSD